MPVKDWKISPRLFVLLIAAAIGISLLPSLSGCGTQLSPIRMAIDAIRGDDLALSAEAETELGRFNAIYRQYVKAESLTNGGSRQLRHFADTFKRVRVRYVRRVADGALIDAALEGVRELEAEPGAVEPAVLVEAALDSMVGSLDPHSAYLNPEELRETSIATKGEFGGLGIEVMMEEGLIKVVSPIEGTPAARAGLKPGDLITHTDGDPIQGLKLLQAVRRMRGVPGTDIRLTIRRGDQPPFDVTITRAIIQVVSVRWRVEGDIGYVRVARFTEKVKNGVEDAMEGIRAQLGSRLKGIVLDLRYNPGGLLEQSVILADEFLDKGVIVSVKGRAGTHEESFDARAGDLARGLPMVVLINGGSASASEIVAGALKDQRRATIMGMRSFGKGSVQTITPLPVEGALKLTTQLYYSPTGRAIQAHWVEPDIAILPAEAGETRRESDLPGALPAVSADDKAAKVKVLEKNCPVAGEKEKEDRQLGCALAFLNAGSAAKFLASFGARENM